MLFNKSEKPGLVTLEQTALEQAGPSPFVKKKRKKYIHVIIISKENILNPIYVLVCRAYKETKETTKS